MNRELTATMFSFRPSWNFDRFPKAVNTVCSISTTSFGCKSVCICRVACSVAIVCMNSMQITLPMSPRGRASMYIFFWRMRSALSYATVHHHRPVQRRFLRSFLHFYHFQIKFLMFTAVLYLYLSSILHHPDSVSYRHLSLTDPMSFLSRSTLLFCQGAGSRQVGPLPFFRLTLEQYYIHRHGT